MKLFILKILLQRRAKDEGFTLPMVIALGLIMILLGTVNILSAGEENLTAISTNQKNEALAIAEVGVARYRELLDRNRILTVYNSSSWGSLSNTCDTSITIEDAADDTNWEQVSNGTENIGQYRIVSYVYDIDGDLTDNDDNQFAPNDDNANTTDAFGFNDDPNTYDPKGILTIKSQATDGSEAQVQVEIPIRINEGDLDNLRPALWIGNRNATHFGNLRLGSDSDLGEDEDGNIVLTQPAIPAGGGSTAASGCNNPTVTSGALGTSGSKNNVISDARPLPAIIDPNSLDQLDLAKRNIRVINVTSGESILGSPDPLIDVKWKDQTWANGQSTSFYYYETTSLTVNNSRLTSDGSARVVILVDGDIDLTNQAILDAGGRYASSILLEIYGTPNTQNITLQPNGQNIDITAFIHAPDATVKVEGTTGSINIKGAVWVKDWDASGGAGIPVRITPDSAGFGSKKSYEYYLGTDNRAAKPITDAPINWEIQEVAEETTSP